MEGNSVLASITGNVPVIEEGEKGAKGATERPRSWDEIPDGSAIESGTGNEQWIDIVLYGDDWYQCIRSFTKGNGVLPTNTIYFKVITDYKRLATGLFLARKAYIHNLGVDNVLITDQGEGKGNVMLKADKYGITCNFDKLEGLDIYRRVAPYKNFLKLPNCKLKTVEEFLGIKREDGYTGGELIQVYHDYTTSYDYNLYRTLLLHNSDDMKGMLEILPILSYYDLFNCNLKARKVQSNYYNDIHGIPRRELILQLVFASPLPVSISFMGRGCHFKGEGYEGTLIVPIYEEELKYFYANYKNYYYLPTEDMAIHKSIASFVDKDYREQATAENCYTRKFSLYLPQWEVLTEPFFKRDYRSRDLFFELTDDIKKDRDLFSRYASHILNAMALQ